MMRYVPCKPDGGFLTMVNSSMAVLESPEPQILPTKGNVGFSIKNLGHAFLRLQMDFPSDKLRG